LLAFREPEQLGGGRRLRLGQFHLPENGPRHQDRRHAADLPADVLPGPTLFALDVEQFLRETVPCHWLTPCAVPLNLTPPSKQFLRQSFPVLPKLRGRLLILHPRQPTWKGQSMRSERFDFLNTKGEKLAAVLDLPLGKPTAHALFAHCFTCGKDNLAAKRIAGRLAINGIAVLRFDFTGLGGSEGEFANTHFSSSVDDLVAAADHLRKTYGAPAILIGHSLGGAAVLAAAQRIPDARAVVTIAAPYDPGHVVGLFKKQADKIRERGEVEVTLAGRPFRIKREFLDDVAEKKLDECLANLRKALLVFHSPTDDTVGIENASHIFQAAKHPKSFVSLAGADHLLSQKSDAIYVANVIAAWAERYLDQPEIMTEAEVEAGLVLVRETHG